MFNSASPRREGEKDGYGRRPANPGTYNAAALADYLTGYRDGAIAREANEIGFASFDE